ncbi:11378_t:CDS:10 [Acaulospora morrowiae]|uniref:11378_t:CDS:1 n=1 Tax=Acaulospora morrowiae TaxID=94023 RepID=A0A9N9F8Z5_9GLOM|nr:11378_t:CDS:10 [Acaulospora morrowiae]
MSNTQVLFVKRPIGLFNPRETFKIVKTPIPTREDLKNEEILVKIRYLSLDPAMRPWMNDTRSYMKPLGINDIMRGNAIGEVIISKNPQFKVGDIVLSAFGWQKYAVSNGKDVVKINPFPGVSISDYLGVLGLTGLTAYFGLFDSKVKAGETVVVSGAAGATGSVAGQLAKIKGATVIGIAGSKSKCDWIKNELGFDIALNYRDPDFVGQFQKATPNYIDVYFDNVGGEILDLCLSRLAKNARIAFCGAISQYNEKKIKGISNYPALISNTARIEGFLIFDYQSRFPEAIRDISKWLKEGKIKRREYIINGLENAPEGLLKLFKGENTGKFLVNVGDDVKAKL